MEQFDYPHNPTGAGTRESRTASVNKITFPAALERIRADAIAREIPLSTPETLQFLCVIAAARGAEQILEIGTAVGASTIALCQTLPKANITTIEKDARFFAEAAQNIEKAGLKDRTRLINADAADALKVLESEGASYDLVFLDGPKVQYIRYLPHIKNLLRTGGVIFADDVLLYGWVNGEAPVPQKRKMLVQHIREYLEAVQTDEQLLTTVVDVGDGVALSVKK